MRLILLLATVFLLGQASSCEDDELVVVPNGPLALQLQADTDPDALIDLPDSTFYLTTTTGAQTLYSEMLTDSRLPTFDVSALCGSQTYDFMLYRDSSKLADLVFTFREATDDAPCGWQQVYCTTCTSSERTGQNWTVTLP